MSKLTRQAELLPPLMRGFGPTIAGQPAEDRFCADATIASHRRVGLKKLEQPDFTVSTRAGLPPLVIIADDDVPEPYWVPQPPKLDRQSLLADLKRGDVIPGAQLGNPKPCLAVRTK